MKIAVLAIFIRLITAAIRGVVKSKGLYLRRLNGGGACR
jgi:hypothetical protein